MEQISKDPDGEAAAAHLSEVWFQTLSLLQLFVQAGQSLIQHHSKCSAQHDSEPIGGSELFCGSNTGSSLPVCHSLHRIFESHFGGTGQPIRAQFLSAATAEKKKKKKVWACMCSVYNACVCEGETEEARPGSSAEPPFLWHLWQMARPFEEQSTAIDIKLPALKTEGPAQPHLFTVSPRAAWAARPVTNAALVPRFIHNVGQCQPAKSITSHSSAAGGSVISTLSPPQSGRTSASVYFMITTSMFLGVYLSNVIDFTHIHLLCLIARRGSTEREDKRAGWFQQHRSGPVLCCTVKM